MQPNPINTTTPLPQQQFQASGYDPYRCISSHQLPNPRINQMNYQQQRIVQLSQHNNYSQNASHIQQQGPPLNGPQLYRTHPPSVTYQYPVQSHMQYETNNNQYYPFNVKFLYKNKKTFV